MTPKLVDQNGLSQVIRGEIGELALTADKYCSRRKFISVIFDFKEVFRSGQPGAARTSCYKGSKTDHPFLIGDRKKTNFGENFEELISVLENV